MSGAICYAEPTKVTVSIGTIIIIVLLFILLIRGLGTLISYIPWIVTILKKRSSEGISVLTLASGLLAGTLNLINASILNWDKILCCGNNAGALAASQCLANNLVVEQLAVGPVCMLCVFVLVLWFMDVTPVPNNAAESRAKLIAYRWALASFLGTLVIAILATIVALALYYSGLVSGPWVMSYGKWIGIASALLTLLQWSPQIVVTWRAQEAGAFSLGTLLIQFPGALLVVIFQVSAPRSHWTSWAPFIVSGAQMLVLIALLLFFRCRSKASTSPKDTNETLTLLDEDPDEDLASFLTRLVKGRRPVNVPRNTRMQ